jgi:hypothetical protein
MVKKLPIRLWIKPVINSLREGSKRWSDLMQIRIRLSKDTEKQISEKTLDRILGDYLEYWELVRKEGDYVADRISVLVCLNCGYQELYRENKKLNLAPRGCFHKP